MGPRDKSKIHVAVMMGGLSSEREVSLTSGEGIAKTLIQSGYQVTLIDMQQDIAEKLCSIKPDIVFNALHGTYGEDGSVQGLLNILAIPYTHSGVLSSSLCMDKVLSKAILTSYGILCPKHILLTREEILAGHILLKAPYVIKPIREGSSVGVQVIFEEDNKSVFEEHELPFSHYMIEPYIAGKELHVAVLQDKALGAIEIVPKGRFYDYEAKYTEGKATHIMPAPLSAIAYEKLLDIASQVHKILGCKTMSRVDFRYDEVNDLFYVLEVNTHPGFTPLSLVPEIAAYKNISYGDLCDILIEEASFESATLHLAKIPHMT